MDFTRTRARALDYNWDSGALYQAYSDYIGFNATMQVNMTRTGPVSFVIGNDDGSALWIDGGVVINLGGGTYKTGSLVVYLSEGIHDLMLIYYEVQGGAIASFHCDYDITMWYP